MQTKQLVEIVKESGEDWSADNATRLAASLAYYTVLSIAPTLVLARRFPSATSGREDRDRA